MSALVFYVLLSLSSGALYALFATGLVVTYKGSGIVNFAYGAMAMYSVYTFTQLRAHGMGTPLAIAVSVAVAAALGATAYLVVFRPLRYAPALAKVVGSLGILITVQAVTVLQYGTSNQAVANVLPSAPIRNVLGLGYDLPEDRVIFLAIAVLVPAALWAAYKWTPFGIATRAASASEKGALLTGHSPSMLAAANWAIASVVGAGIGMLIAPVSGLVPSNFTLFVVPALGAALVGGLESIPLAAAGGIGLGVLDGVVTWMSGQTWFPVVLQTGLQDAIPFVIVIVVLYFRGARIPERSTIVQQRLPRSPYPRHVTAYSVILGTAGLVLVVTLKGAWSFALTTSFISCILCLSYVVVTGYLGQISLVQLSFAGVGAFAMTRLASPNGHGTLNLPFPAGPILAVAVAVVLGVIVGLPAIRIRGLQLAVVTITAAIALEDFVFSNPSLAGVTGGTAIPVSLPTLFGFSLGAQNQRTGLIDRWQFGLLCLVLLLICVLVVVWIRTGPLGRSFLAVRANERAAASAGVNITRTKLLGFAIGSALAGVAGVLFAYQSSAVNSADFDFFVGLSVLAFAYLGGIASVSGGLVGGFLAAGGMVFFIGQRLIPGLIGYEALIGGIGLILTVIANPDGMAPENQALLARLLSKTSLRSQPLRQETGVQP
jgi:branched-subunit amino acid ABC-type transport system permease component